MLSLLLCCFLLPFSLSRSNADPPDPPPHVEAMLGYDGFREIGHNRGWLPDKVNAYVGNPKGSPYCAATISWVLDSVGVETPRVRSGLAANFRTRQSVRASRVITGREQINIGDLAGWQKGKTIYGHIGVVVEIKDKKTIRTVDANTNCGGRGTIRDGGGVCVKTRTIAPFDYFGIRWFTPVRYPEVALSPGEQFWEGWWSTTWSAFGFVDVYDQPYDVRGLWAV